MNDNEIVRLLTKILIGTDIELANVPIIQAQRISSEHAEKILDDDGVLQCPSCGFWFYDSGEYDVCEDCANEE